MNCGGRNCEPLLQSVLKITSLAAVLTFLSITDTLQIHVFVMVDSCSALVLVFFNVCSCLTLLLVSSIPKSNGVIACIVLIL